MNAEFSQGRNVPECYSFHQAQSLLAVPFHRYEFPGVWEHFLRLRRE
jgi:hypothetical protein